MSGRNRTCGAAAVVLSLFVTGCGAFTSPSEPGAAIAGRISGGGAGLSSFSAHGVSAATAPSALTVTVVGTNLTVNVDASGNFQIAGVPAGDVQLQFSDGTNTATVSLSNVSERDLVELILTFWNGTVTVISETRTSGRVELCHKTDNGSYHLIEVSVSAEPAHRSHGDGEIGDVVPADPTKVFNRQCRPVPPQVQIESKTNGEDADEAPGPSILVGSQVTWTYVVTNTGSRNLTSVRVVDDKIGPVTCLQTSLAVGQSMTCSATGVAVAGQYRNVATVTATYLRDMYTDTDASHYYGTQPATQVDGPKVQLCHRTGNGRYHLIEVSISAEPAHLGHGDGRPGQAVPGGGGTFTASCAVR